MREFEAGAEEKAGFELKKAAEKRAALDKALVEAHELCKAAGEDFKAFQQKYAPDYKRTRLYQVLAIADGRKTVEGVREEERERKRRQRASVRDNPNVPDDPAPDSPPTAPAAPVAPLAAQGERDVEAVKAHKFVDEAPAFTALRARAESLGYSLTHHGGNEFFLINEHDEEGLSNRSRSGLDAVADQLDKVQVKALNAAPPPADDLGATTTAPIVEAPSNGRAVNGRADDDQPLAVKLHYHLNDIWSLCSDPNNWSHLDDDQKVELRGAMTKLGYLRNLLPRLATLRELSA